MDSWQENQFEENYFFSDGKMLNFFFIIKEKCFMLILFLGSHIEPGYYKSDHWGIRIESILRVVPANFEVP